MSHIKIRVCAEMCHSSIRIQEVSYCFWHFSKTCWFKTLARSDGGRGGSLKLVRLNIYLEKREDLININPLPLEYTLEFMEYFINLSYFDLSTRESGRCGVVTSISVFQISNREGE